ncbi:unnamed protein product [Calicophoron daubneyi]|uniref:Uncharacterized protein n=1 Tax=Calicophoron daubneyi TaxID=300641 RepID=A0AAV2TXJ5_CALDB
MGDDSGLLEFKSLEEMNENMEELGLRFRHGCEKEKNPISCHSLAQWLETFKHSPEQSVEILKQNCYERKFGDSCFKYSALKLFGRTNVARDPLAAYQALEFGCNSCSHAKCCQGAGRVVADGIASHAPSLTAALPLFERGCQLGLAESCFHLGGALFSLSERAKNKASEASKGTGPGYSLELRNRALVAWTKGCELGHEFACRNVSRMFSIGDGIERDQVRADEFMRKANSLIKNPKADILPPVKTQTLKS